MTTLERYQLLDELGRGGMGVVYRARDTQLGREVALKLLPAALAQEQTALRRFQQEAQIVAQLEHPHIAPIYDIGVREGQPFIVMRLLRGGSLQERLLVGQIAPEVLWQILRQIGRALDAIHLQHIIHRDIKPTNILFDENGQAYLADFGIAKALDATTQYTGNAIIGSPAYMSPEQFIGEAVSGQTDQYSLAIVAFQALAGQLPFQGNASRLMYSHLQQPPPAISLLNHNLPSVLDKVLQRALAKEPTARYETLEAFVNALERAAKGATKPLPPLVEPVEPELNKPSTTSRSERISFFYRQGLEAFNAQQWPEAAEAFRQVLALDPHHINAKNRYQQTQQQLSQQHTAVIPAEPAHLPKPQPTPRQTTNRPALPKPSIDALTASQPQIIKGAGGQVTAPPKRRFGFMGWLAGAIGLIAIFVMVVVVIEMINNPATPAVLATTPAQEPTPLAISQLEESPTPEEVTVAETRQATSTLTATAAPVESTATEQPSPTFTSTPIATATPAPTTTTTPPPTNTPTPRPTLIASPPPPTTTGATPTSQTIANNPTPTIQSVGSQPTGNPSEGAGFPLSFTNFGRWVRGDQANGTFTPTSEQSRSGQAARLDYSFGTTSNDFVVFLQTNAISDQPNILSAWVYGDGAGHYLNIWIIDNDGQTWQVPLGRITHTGWREMIGGIDTTQNWPWTHISGPNNGIVDYPIRFRAFVLDDVNDAYIGSGTIYIDDVTSRTGQLASVPTSAAPPPASTSTAATPIPTASPTAVASFSGDVGRIIYTSGNTLLTTDPTWTSPQEIGTFSSDSCASPASTVAGQNFNLYFSPFCAIGEGTRVCTSPNGQLDLIFNGTFTGGFSLSVRATGTEGSGQFIYGGSDFDVTEGLRWSPSSNQFLFVLGDTVHTGFPQGGYSMIIPTAYNPNFSADGSLILYRKPIGPGVNDVFVANADGSNQRNVTNVSSIDKRCAAWVR